MKRVLLMTLCMSVMLTGCAGAKKHMESAPDVTEVTRNAAETTHNA